MEIQAKSMNDEERDMLRRYVEAVIIPRMNTDNIKYPLRDSRVDHLFLKECTREFVDDLNELKNKGYSYEDIGRIFVNPGRLMRMAHRLLKGAKLNGFSIDEQRGLILELLKIIKTQKSRNIFNEDKRNIILDSEALARIMGENNSPK